MTTRSAPVAVRARSPIFSALVGLASIGILLQGVWAGIFIRSGHANDATWVHVHARCGEVTIAVSVVAFAFAAWKLRSRADLLVGTATLAALLVVEAYIGGEIYKHEALEVIHFPLALALLGLAVWLPMRARR
ncbi:MAG: hypothetical protein JO147_04535 [Actinobacteria bacterium]|nr:hypothetical protein [Actinomycetota bacterium]